MKKAGPDLITLIERSRQLQGVQRADLRAGDLVLVATRNSVYALRVLDQATYLVSGGWFDRQGLAPLRTTVTGCTWGGCILKSDVVAVCGMCLEFGNRVVTSTIQKVCVFRHGMLN